jgi:glucose-6-phosphate isomerase
VAGREYAKLIAAGTRAKLLPGIMARRAEVFTKKPDVRDLIAARLGWVDIASSMSLRIGEIESFGARVLADGLTQIVIVGMGGSSLCPEVFKLLFGRRTGVKSIDILDSTDPAAVLSVAKKLDLQKTLFIVASKSGGTIETRSHEAFFTERLKAVGVSEIGRHFCAITDPGSDLEKSACENRYRQVFTNPADIGGRYSALSFFGLVPGWFAGVNLKKLLGDAAEIEPILAERNDESNPALALGALMAAATRLGCDKLTFVASKKIAPFIPWIEQLIAESTGKLRQGVVPVEGEPQAALTEYGKDRAFVFMRFSAEREPKIEKLRRQCDKARIPTVEIVLANKYELGRQFLIWEAATAACGSFLNINPFDEPNVTESKNNTQGILRAFQSSGHFPEQRPQKRWGKLSLVAIESTRKAGEKDCATLECTLRYFFKDIKPPRYLALLNYVERSPQTEKALATVRAVIRRQSGLTTLRGYGPRFLHSIGQLYKGGPLTGVFIVLVREHYNDLPVPGRYFSFGDLIRAQAIGDTQALISRKLPVLVLGVNGNPAVALRQLEQSLKMALLKRKE